MPRSAREIDLDPNTYIGLSFPLRSDNNNNFAMTKTSLQQSEHNLRNLLLTHPGERVNQPEFGCRLRELCFEQRDEELPTRIEETIKESVSTWLPYITIHDVATLTDEGSPNNVFVKLKYSTNLNPNTFEQITIDTSYSAKRY
jgi:phage baseplate assembly protein W